MARRFNTVGSCSPNFHYILTEKERLPQVKAIVDQSGCFWVHGPRQTGKSTVMKLWAATLTKQGKYAAILVSVASLANGGIEESTIAEDAFLYELRESASLLPEDLQPPDWGYQISGQKIRSAFSTWADVCPRPLVIFMDDVERLDGRSLSALLCQIGSGMQGHPRPFPQSIGFVSLQDVNSCSVDSLAGTPGSLFHTLRTTTLALQSFTLEEVANVYQAHTDVTGQLFTLEAVDRAFELTQGQPWLVNALGQHAIEHTDDQIDSFHIEAAATYLLQSQSHHHTTPLDHLTSRLNQFQGIIEAVLSEQVILTHSNQDILDIVALGLCRFNRSGGLILANPLYQEIIIQTLAMPAIASLGHIRPSWINRDGTINLNQVWEVFVQLWTSQGDRLIQTIAYPTLAPYIAVLSFFHYLTYPDGSLNVTYGFNQQYVLLTLHIHSSAMAIELTAQIVVWLDGQPDPLDWGLAQLDTQRQSSSSSSQDTPSCLIILDQRSDRPSCHERTRLDIVTTASGQTLPVIRG